VRVKSANRMRRGVGFDPFLAARPIVGRDFEPSISDTEGAASCKVLSAIEIVTNDLERGPGFHRPRASLRSRDEE
jgi:hypothetical protein